MNKEQKELILFRKVQNINKGMKSEHSTLLSKSILKDLITINEKIVCLIDKGV